ncbi:hypothetical protein K501DRAFT_285498 [Backusella circina FSU 941]|nr:hypothetical protein K501DRAFT_285498 [Backusella circina FSU 941]
MDFFPSPPSSPLLGPNDNKAFCGACDKVLGSDWFCSDCHCKCNICNRFLGENEYCSRCWTFDPNQNQYLRKYYSSSLLSFYNNQIIQSNNRSQLLSILPSPSNSSDKPC